MINVIMMLILIAIGLFCIATATDPKLARWLCYVLYARALAVEEARKVYRDTRSKFKQE